MRRSEIASDLFSYAQYLEELSSYIRKQNAEVSQVRVMSLSLRCMGRLICTSSTRSIGAYAWYLLLRDLLFDFSVF